MQRICWLAIIITVAFTPLQSKSRIDVKANSRYGANTRLMRDAVKYDAISANRRRLPADFWSDNNDYNEEEEQMLDDWIDGLSYGEAIYFYNVLSDASYDYDDEYEYTYDLDDDITDDKETLFSCTNAQCDLDKADETLRKVHCKHSSCLIQCKGSACGKEYIKPQKGVKAIKFKCNDKCERAVILMAGIEIGNRDKMVKRITGEFQCHEPRCSPQFVGFYKFKSAKISGGTSHEYPTNSQINFKEIEDVEIKIQSSDSSADLLFTQCSIYTEKVTSLKITVNVAHSFQDILLDIRGAYKVSINCNKPGACDRLVVRYQQTRCKKGEIYINCASDACEQLKFLHESWEDKFGKKKQCAPLIKKKHVIPKITISGAKKNLKFSSGAADINNAKLITSQIIAKCGEGKRKVLWYDKHQDDGKVGTYELVSAKVCLTLTKDKEKMGVELMSKKHNKGYQLEKRTNVISKVGGKMEDHGDLTGIALDVITTGLSAVPIVGGAAAAVTGYIPIFTSALGSWIEKRQNKNLKVFWIIWEDNTEKPVKDNEDANLEPRIIALENKLQNIEKKLTEIESKVNDVAAIKADVGRIERQIGLKR